MLLTMDTLNIIVQTSNGKLYIPCRYGIFTGRQYTHESFYDEDCGEEFFRLPSEQVEEEVYDHVFDICVENGFSKRSASKIAEFAMEHIHAEVKHLVNKIGGQ